MTRTDWVPIITTAQRDLTQKKTELVEEIPFFPTTTRRIASVGESRVDGDGNDGSSYQCPEPGSDEDF